MYAEPINDRVTQLLARNRSQVLKLMNMGWEDNAIAGYLCSDRLTIRRIRKLVESGLA